MLVAHADWGSKPQKQWVTVARREARGKWSVFAPVRVGSVGSLRERLHAEHDETAVLGFDFPIGVPLAYATRAGITDFVAFLKECGHGRWREFFEVADRPEEITVVRPFYPMTPGPKGARERSHLVTRLGIEYRALLRRCERAQPGQRAACALFWTLGGQQVGKGALAGWRLLQAEPSETVFWPFAGKLEELVASAPTVVVETYPAEMYGHIGIGKVRGKRQQTERRSKAQAMLRFCSELGTELQPELEHSIEDGFGQSGAGEDQFDSVVGMLGMLNVLEGRRPAGAPPDDMAVRTIEGWMLGHDEPARSSQAT